MNVDLRWVDSETLTEKNAAEELSGCAGILVPGGFGSRGVEGMTAAIRHARKGAVPFLGICLGMQMAVVEFTRNAAGLAGAHSRELVHRNCKMSGTYAVLDPSRIVTYLQQLWIRHRPIVIVNAGHMRPSGAKTPSYGAG